MQVNSVKTQNFGANPSYAIRKSLAKIQAGGKDITELLGLIKDVHTQKYMTMLEENGKVHAIGLSDVIDITATIKPKENPKYQKARHDLFEKIFGHKPGIKTTTSANNLNEDDRFILSFILQADEKQMSNIAQKQKIYVEKKKALEEKYPPILGIEDPSFEKYGYISLFKSVKGESFDRILGKLTSSLKKIKKQQPAEERALDAINAMFPPYEKFVTPGEAGSIARRYSGPHIIGPSRY